VLLHTRRAPTQGFGATHSSSRHLLNRERESYFCCGAFAVALKQQSVHADSNSEIFLFASTRLFAPLSMSATYVVNTVGEHKTCVCEECVTVAQRRCGFSFEISAASLLASPSGGAALL
jgi:hypothetical protein